MSFLFRRKKKSDEVDMEARSPETGLKYKAASAVRARIRVSAIAVAVAFVIGCEPFELIGSTWQVVEIGQPAPPDAAATISFGPRNVAGVSTGCQPVDAPYSTDTDGNALSFGHVEIAADKCSNLGLAEFEQRLISALEGVSLWEGGRDRLHLRGVTDVDLINASGATLDSG